MLIYWTTFWKMNIPRCKMFFIKYFDLIAKHSKFLHNLTFDWECIFKVKKKLKC